MMRACFVFLLSLLILVYGVFVFSAEPKNDKIVFSSYRSGNWELWTINPDGTELTQLTNTPDDERSAKWSTDKKRIVYSTNRGEIWTINSELGSPTWMRKPDLSRASSRASASAQKLPLKTSKNDQPVWSPDGNTIIFVSYIVIPEEDSDIWAWEVKGQEGKRASKSTAPLAFRLPLDEKDGVESFPSFSPDGKRIAFSLRISSFPKKVIEEIYVAELDTGKRKQITNTDEKIEFSYSLVNIQVDWSPVGDTLAFASNRANNYDIWTVTASGEKLTQLTDNPAYDASPSWSPDGSKIAFVSTRSRSMELWIMNADGSDKRQLTDDGGNNKEPSWSF